MLSQGSIEWHWYLPTPPRHMPTFRACRGPRSNTAATDWKPRVLCTCATVYCGAALCSLPCHRLHEPLPPFPAQGYFDQDGSVLGHLLLCPIQLPTPQPTLHLLLVILYSYPQDRSIGGSHRISFATSFNCTVVYCHNFLEMLKNLPNILSFRELLSKNFPTNGSLLIFLLYMAMFVAQVPPVDKTIISQLIAYPLFIFTIHMTRFENEVRSYCKSWTNLKVVKCLFFLQREWRWQTRTMWRTAQTADHLF